MNYFIKKLDVLKMILYILVLVMGAVCKWGLGKNLLIVK